MAQDPFFQFRPAEARMQRSSPNELAAREILNPEEHRDQVGGARTILIMLVLAMILFWIPLGVFLLWRRHS